MRCVSQSCTPSKTRELGRGWHMKTIWAALGRLQRPVGSHTGHKWAELLLATGQTGSSTAQPRAGPFPRKTVASHGLRLQIMCACSCLIPHLPRVPQGERARSSFEIKTMLMNESFVTKPPAGYLKSHTNNRGAKFSLFGSP